MHCDQVGGRNWTRSYSGRGRKLSREIFSRELTRAALHGGDDYEFLSIDRAL